MACSFCGWRSLRPVEAACCPRLAACLPALSRGVPRPLPSWQPAQLCPIAVTNPPGGAPCSSPPPPPPRLQILQPIMPSTLFRIFTSVVRGLNNMVGGVSFVMIAKALGVQKAADAAPEPVPLPAPADKKKRK